MDTRKDGSGRGLGLAPASADLGSDASQDLSSLTQMELQSGSLAMLADTAL